MPGVGTESHVDAVGQRKPSDARDATDAATLLPSAHITPTGAISSTIISTGAIFIDALSRVSGVVGVVGAERIND